MAAGLSRAPTNENISSTLSGGITNATVTVTIGDASKLVSPCYLVIDRVDSTGTLKSTSLWEYVKVTNIAGNDLTVTRAQGGSTAQSHSAGAIIEAVPTAAMFTEWYSVLNPEHDSAGGHVIVGTATIAGINLASLATLRYASVGILGVPSSASINNLNVTTLGLSGGIGVPSTASIYRATISDSISFVSLASGPNIVRTSIGSNLVIQKSTFSTASVAANNGVNLGSGKFGAWPKTFTTLNAAWATVDQVNTGPDTRCFPTNVLVNSSTSQPGCRLQSTGSSDSVDVVITIFGMGSVDGGVA